MIKIIKNKSQNTNEELNTISKSKQKASGGDCAV